MAWAAVIGGGAAIAGGIIGSKGAKDAAKVSAEANKQDPRIDNMLWGRGPEPGLLSQYQGMLNQPQSEAMKQYGDMAGSYLTQNGATDMNAMRDAATGMLNPLAAPQAQAAQWNGTPQMSAAQMSAAQAGPAAQSSAQSPIGIHGADVLWNYGEQFSAPQAMQGAQASAAQVQQPGGMQGAQASAAQVQQPRGMQAALASGVQMNTPSQNGLNLSGAFDSLINGAPGANPFLTGAIQKGINQSNNAFGNMLTDAKSATQDVLAGIRSNAVLAGQYGGSRQGIAEGKGVDSFNQNVTRAATQFGQNNTDAAVAAQAGAYDSDRNRQLAATQGLSGQQYGAASTNASLAQQTQLANQSAQQQANSTNYAGQLSGALANAGYAQQTGLANQASANNAAQTNYAGQLSGALANAGYAQQTGLANQASTNNAAQTNYAGQLQANQANAGLKQQANLANQAAGINTSQFNASAANAASMAGAQLGQQNNQFNAGLQQQTGQFNAGLQQQTGMANLGNQQQTNLANLQALLGTNQLNSGRTTAGLSTLSGLLGTAYAGTANQDAYALNRAQGVNGLLAPYLTGQPNQQPVASNAGAAGLGGAMQGLALGNSLAGMFGGQPGATSLQTTGSAGSYHYAPTQLPVQSFPYSW